MDFRDQARCTAHNKHEEDRVTGIHALDSILSVLLSHTSY